MGELPARDPTLAEDETDLRLLPPLRAGWARRGGDAPVPISGGNAKRVLFGAVKPTPGPRRKSWRGPCALARIIQGSWNGMASVRV